MLRITRPLYDLSEDSQLGAHSFFFFFLVEPPGMWDFSCLTKD